MYVGLHVHYDVHRIKGRSVNLKRDEQPKDLIVCKRGGLGVIRKKIYENVSLIWWILR